MWRIRNLSWWIRGTWCIDEQLFHVKLRQKFLCRMKTVPIIKFYGNSTKNESDHFHKKVKWVNSAWKRRDHSVWNNPSHPGGQDSSRRQTVFFLLIQETKIMKILNILTSLHHVERETFDLAIKEGLTFNQTRSNAIILQGALPAFCIPKVVRMEDWRSFVWKNHTTITIGPEGMINWVVQLNNSQLANSFNSLVEKDTEDVFVERPVPTRSMNKVCTKNFVLQIDQGNLRNCLKKWSSTTSTIQSFQQRITRRD